MKSEPRRRPLPVEAVRRQALGVAAAQAGDHETALEHFYAVLDLAPTDHEALHNLGAALLALRRFNIAVFPFTRLVADGGDYAARRLFVLALQEAPAPVMSAAAIARALAEPALDRDILFRRGWALLRTLDVAGVPGLDASGHDLLLALLAETTGGLADFERFFVALRTALLGVERPDRRTVQLGNALARHAFNTEFAATVTEAEQATVAALGDAVPRVLNRADEWRLARLAMYRPLADLDGVAGLLHGVEDYAAPFRALVTATVATVLADRRAAEHMPGFAGIADVVSAEVQQHYEANPYPRWLGLTLPLAGQMRRQLAGLVGADLLPPELRLLVAGCGTGEHAIAARHGYGPQVRVTAIDLSRTSLAYAARKAAELGAGDIGFRQGDLLAVAELGQDFDVVECAGVLHHMADPLAGWRALRGVLAPGGVMFIGLYSEAGRAAVIAARDEIAQRRLTDDADTIRAFRAELLADPSPRGWRAALLDNDDFYTLSNCRDLLFHRHEQRFTLAGIAAALQALDLGFLGFVWLPAEATAACGRDLEKWAAWEAARPETFARMYQFYCADAAAR